MKIWFAIIGWGACLLVFSGLLLDAEAVGQDGKKPSKVESPAIQKIPIDWAVVVKSLRSSNTAPQIRGPNPKFPPGYSYAEQRRIDKTVHVLLTCTEDAWSELVRNVSTPGYSMTIEVGAGATWLTVGDVCERIIRDTLVAQYEQVFDSYKFTDLELPINRNPAFIDREKLLAWLETRRGVPVVQLQIEHVEDVLKRMRSGEGKAEGELRAKVIAGLEDLIDDLKVVGAARTSPKLFIYRETSGYLYDDPRPQPQFESPKKQ